MCLFDIVTIQVLIKSSFKISVIESKTKCHNLKLLVLSLKYIKTKSDTIKIKKSRIFFCYRKCNFSVGALMHLKKMRLNFKKDCNLTKKYDSKSVFFWRYYSLKPMIGLFILELLPEDDHWRALQASMGKPAVGWKRSKERYWTT